MVTKEGVGLFDTFTIRLMKDREVRDVISRHCLSRPFLAFEVFPVQKLEGAIFFQSPFEYPLRAICGAVVPP
ncbi:hypothetical protein ATTO_12520 [Leptogranulimonas caecicola]|uniref:Uncharacterized protein n=1 Tax=Leptogranulimonas caecicola TaxID=2894156 RepID=A0AAU9C525_9ACTN|nr:hypothetical protein ATTO_12520 [Leptogranulimonas caecicola]